MIGVAHLVQLFALFLGHVDANNERGRGADLL